MYLFIGYDRCSTCQKAEHWLQENGIPYIKRSIKEEKPQVEELRLWQSRSNLSLRRFFNTNGLLYKELALKDKLADMSEEQMLTLLAADGMLVRRPLLVCDNTVLVGFHENTWANALK